MTLISPEVLRGRRRKGAGTASRERLRLWLRMLRVSRGVEAELRERLRVTYNMTLPQFDVLAALARHPAGVNMTELSRYLMVSNGNVTGIVDRLAEEGWLERAAIPGDRRATLVKLTARGASDFAAVAAVHEGWVDELLSSFDKAETSYFVARLDVLVASLREGGQREPAKATKGRRK